MILEILAIRVYNITSRFILIFLQRMVIMNRFVLNETSYHGAGAINSIPDEINGRGFKKVLVASDPDLVKFGVTKKSY